LQKEIARELKKKTHSQFNVESSKSSESDAEEINEPKENEFEEANEEL